MSDGREREREWWEVFSAGSEREGWSALIGWFGAVRSSWNLEGGVWVWKLFFLIMGYSLCWTIGP